MYVMEAGIYFCNKAVKWPFIVVTLRYTFSGMLNSREDFRSVRIFSEKQLFISRNLWHDFSVDVNVCMKIHLHRYINHIPHEKSLQCAVLTNRHFFLPFNFRPPRSQEESSNFTEDYRDKRWYHFSLSLAETLKFGKSVVSREMFFFGSKANLWQWVSIQKIVRFQVGLHS